MRRKFKDSFGFDIEGLEEAETAEQKITALEAHLSLIEGLTNECICDLERRISDIKY